MSRLHGSPSKAFVGAVIQARAMYLKSGSDLFFIFSFKILYFFMPGYNVQHYIYIDNIYWKIYIKNIKIVVLGKLPERKIYRDSLSNRLSASTPIVHKKTNLIRLDDATYKGIVFKYDM